MTDHDHFLRTHGQDPEGGAAQYLRRGRWIFWIFVIIAALFLISEHRAHVLGALPYLVILACPLLHMFMHRGHGHGGPTDRRAQAHEDPE